MQTEPSYRPAASTLGCSVENSMDVTPDLVDNDCATATPAKHHAPAGNTRMNGWEEGRWDQNGTALQGNAHQTPAQTPTGMQGGSHKPTASSPYSAAVRPPPPIPIPIPHLLRELGVGHGPEKDQTTTRVKLLALLRVRHCQQVLVDAVPGHARDHHAPRGRTVVRPQPLQLVPGPLQRQV
jgi:hypothetical protein